jgi:hypothetical protein
MENVFKDTVGTWMKDVNEGFSNLSSGVRRDLAGYYDTKHINSTTTEDLFKHAAAGDLLAEKILVNKEPTLFTQDQKLSATNKYYDKEVVGLKEEINYMKKHNSFFNQPFIDKKNEQIHNLYAKRDTDINEINNSYAVHPMTTKEFGASIARGNANALKNRRFGAPVRQQNMLGGVYYA